MLGAVFGYRFSPLLDLSAAYNNRSGFKYRKDQTSIPIAGRTRFFNLENQTLLFNAALHGAGISDSFVFGFAGWVIDPFISGGIGIARNVVTNFHTLSSVVPGQVLSIMNDNARHSFAAQLGAGADIYLAKQWGATFGYRFLYGGKFQSNDYIQTDANFSAVSVLPWKGQLMANEVYAKLSYYFA
jgi:opacity protein-like surface antigen